MPRFNDEKMIEICRIRESFRAYKDKIQPYPVEEETQPPIIERKTVFVENLTDGKFLKLQALVHNLSEKLEKHLTSTKKKQYRDNNTYIIK